MYIFIAFADNKIVLLTIIISFIVLIFPFFIKVNVSVINKKTPVFYSIYLFNFIKILDGYIEMSKSYMINYLYYKKEKIIPYKSLFNMKNKIAILHDYHFLSVKSCINIGFKDNLEKSIYASFFLNQLFNNVIQVVKEYKNYIKTYYFINLIEDDDVLEAHTKITVVFNILMIIVSFFKFLVEKIKNGKQK